MTFMVASMLNFVNLMRENLVADYSGIISKDFKFTIEGIIKEPGSPTLSIISNQTCIVKCTYACGKWDVHKESLDGCLLQPACLETSDIRLSSQYNAMRHFN